MFLIFYFDLGVSEACIDGYKELYGADASNWPPEIKEHLRELADSSVHDRGIVSYI